MGKMMTYETPRRNQNGFCCEGMFDTRVSRYNRLLEYKRYLHRLTTEHNIKRGLIYN
jgi:hypothetical protein